MSSSQGPHETPLPGWVTPGVVRVGDTVRRPAGPNDPRVRRLLEHLESVGFDAAPRFFGTDERGRMILTFIEGAVPSDCRSIVWTDEQLGASGSLLRRFHDATAGADVAEGEEVVCHHDFGPWNLVWRHDLPIGIIDFDNVAPGAHLDDLGYAAWKHLNLGLVDLPAEEQARRLRVLSAAYSAQVDERLLAAIEHAQERMEAMIVGREGIDIHARERRWLRENGEQLVA